MITSEVKPDPEKAKALIGSGWTGNAVLLTEGRGAIVENVDFAHWRHVLYIRMFGELFYGCSHASAVQS